ncbi:hypothetical protein A9Q99_17495 [Gammaproteobacteria bacterium 45_16_T64]|nr:hypothetical protein A9Q99_17495 [Gammaproteobacteria bacterium 45_16_T64]
MMIQYLLISHPPNRIGNISTLITALLCLIVSLSVDPVYAKDKPVGSVVRVVGDVTAIGKNGKGRKLKIQQAIYSGDRLQTGKQSGVTVNFYDLTRIILRPNAIFYIKAFPATMNAGNIEMELIKGGARVTSGTIASQSQERFRLKTPAGVVNAGRAEWVVRDCESDECNVTAKEFKQCHKYRTPAVKDAQIVSVYKGEVRTNYCSAPSMVKSGTTGIIDRASGECLIVNEIPCLILFDGKMGRDKIRTYSKQLTLVEPGDDIEIGSAEKQSPEGVRPDSRNSRPSSRTRRTTPRIDRPRRNRR